MGDTLTIMFPAFAIVGPGSVELLGEQAARLGRRALLVTGRRALRKSGATERLTALLDASGVAVELFADVPCEPDVATVDRARERLRAAGCDMVVEAGGGSALDVGKAAAALAHAEEPTAHYHRGQAIPPKGLPHIAVPTTAGTGAEATPNSVLTDLDGKVKKSLRAPGLLPTACVVDAELTLTCPPTVTAASGMDALAQAIESYLSVRAASTTGALSLEAVRLIASCLPVAYERGGDLAARAAVLEASFMAGLAMGSARLGAVHGLAHPLGLFYGLPHGVVCAVLLPHVMRRNAPAAPEKYARLREAMGTDPLRAVQTLIDTLELPRALGPYPDPERERAILDYALPSGSSRANPVPVTETFVREVLREVCT